MRSHRLSRRLRHSLAWFCAAVVIASGLTVVPLGSANARVPAAGAAASQVLARLKPPAAASLPAVVVALLSSQTGPGAVVTGAATEVVGGLVLGFGYSAAGNAVLDGFVDSHREIREVIGNWM